MDLYRKVVRVEARYAKNGQARDVALGEVAISVLTPLRPAEPQSAAAVFIGRRGEPIRDVRHGFNAAVLKVWKPANSEQRSLGSMTSGKRERPALKASREGVSSKAVGKAFLGHADEDVTDTYFVPDLQIVRDAINRAAFSIDGTTLPGLLRFEPRMAQKMAQHPADALEEAKEQS